MAVDEWICNNRPFIVTRQCAPFSQAIAVGLPLPPAQDKRRIGLALPAKAIAGVGCLPELADVVDCAPLNWQRPLRQLADTGANACIQFRVFGSLAWQALTGLNYVTAQSDIDLFWQPTSDRQLAAGLSLLEEWEHQTGLRADGEVQFGNMGAVAWRECLTLRTHPSRQVLLKHAHGVDMRSARELIVQLVAADVTTGPSMDNR